MMKPSEVRLGAMPLVGVGTEQKGVVGADYRIMAVLVGQKKAKESR